mmetsp:Transcript_25575/g.63293  ORF Transcript_25575/g.63293 Transcript_25575/m.63293 type:complete len:203 (-) Transcript_25575:682-1290(-)
MKPQPPVMMHFFRCLVWRAGAAGMVAIVTLEENSRTVATMRRLSESESHQPTGRQTISFATTLSLGRRVLKRWTQECTSLRWWTAETVMPFSFINATNCSRASAGTRMVNSHQLEVEPAGSGGRSVTPGSLASSSWKNFAFAWHCSRIFEMWGKLIRPICALRSFMWNLNPHSGTSGSMRKSEPTERRFRSMPNQRTSLARS